MKLLPLYESKEAIPEGYAELYSEKDGKFIFVGVEGIKTQVDIDKLDTAKEHEITNRKTAVKELADLTKKFDGVDVEQYNKWKTDQATAKLKKENPDANLDHLKLQNDYDDLKTQNDELITQVTGFKESQKASTIKSALLKVAGELKFNPAYNRDVERYASDFNISESNEVMTKDGKSVTDYFSHSDFNRFVSPSNGGGGGSHTQAPTNSTEREQKFADAKKEGRAGIKDMIANAPPIT